MTKHQRSPYIDRRLLKLVRRVDTVELAQSIRDDLNTVVRALTLVKVLQIDLERAEAKIKQLEKERLDRFFPTP